MKVMLCCSAGMSTNLLVNKMVMYAKQRALEVEIEAIPEADINKRITEADVFLLGPQVRFRLNACKEIAEPAGIPVAVIDPVKYSKMDGKAVLEAALALYEEAHSI